MKIPLNKLERWRKKEFTIKEIFILIKLSKSPFFKNILKQNSASKGVIRRYLGYEKSGGFIDYFLDFLIQEGILIRFLPIESVEEKYIVNKKGLDEIIISMEIYQMIKKYLYDKATIVIE